jgi:hypothetical protein
MVRRLHRPPTNSLIGYGVQIVCLGCLPLLLCERWALRVMHWVPPPSVLLDYSQKRLSWFDGSEAGAKLS